MHGAGGNHRGVDRRIPVPALALAVLALASAAALVYFIWPGASARTAGTAAATPTESPLPPIVTAGLTPGNPAHVAAWNAGQGGAALAAIRSHLGTVLMAHSVGQFAQMRQECRSLAIDVKTASGRPPIPDVAIQNLYVKAQASLASGAAKCQASIKGKTGAAVHANKKLLGKAMTELNAGGKELSNATGKIRTSPRPGSNQ